MSFKDNLKSELEYQDIQLKELAARTGISINTLGNYLTGHNSIPAADSAVKIAKALGVTVEYLVTGRDSDISKKQLSPELKKIIDNLVTFDNLDVEAVQALITAMQKRYKVK